MRTAGLQCPGCERVLPLPQHLAPPTTCKCGLGMEVRGNTLRTWQAGPWLLSAASSGDFGRATLGG